MKQYDALYSINELIEIAKDSDVIYDLSWLKGCYFDHLPEIVAEMWGDPELTTLNFQCNALSKLDNKDVQLRIIKEHHDGRRLWMLVLVTYLDKPVMLIQNAGREGDDHHMRYIIDTEHYQLMLDYVHALIPKPKAQWNQDNDSYNSVKFEILTDLNEQRRSFTNFYGSDIDTVHLDSFR